MRNACEKCKEGFQEQDKRYLLELPRKLDEKAVNVTVCYLCAIEILKEVLSYLGVNIWNRSVMDLYRLLFPGTVSSFYLQVLMKALEQMYLQDWAEKPSGEFRLFV